jgi:hypothetical protein
MCGGGLEISRGIFDEVDFFVVFQLFEGRVDESGKETGVQKREVRDS